MKVSSVNNFELIKDKLFKPSEDGESFYIIKVFVRRKDVIEDPVLSEIYRNAFGAHSERLIDSFSVSTHKEFEDYFNLAKTLCDNIPFSRAYFNVNRKSTRKALRELNKQVTALSERIIMSGNVYPGMVKEISRIARSVTSIKEVDESRDQNWILLDCDFFESKHEKELKKYAFQLHYQLRDELKDHNIDFVEYSTPHGKHILIPNKYAHLFKNPKGEMFELYQHFIGLDCIDEKINAAAILYMNQGGQK